MKNNKRVPWQTRTQTRPSSFIAGRQSRGCVVSHRKELHSKYTGCDSECCGTCLVVEVAAECHQAAHCLVALSANELSLQQRSTFYLRLSALRLWRDESWIKFADVDMGSFNLRISNYAVRWALCWILARDIFRLPKHGAVWRARLLCGFYLWFEFHLDVTIT